MGNDAFEYCKALQKINIPKECTATGSPFSGCESLSNVTFDSGIKKIPDNILASCSGLKQIVIPSTVTVIGHNAFSNCDNLETVTIPSSVTEIGYDAFYSCDKLKNITLPAGLKKLGSDAFRSCKTLEKVVFNAIDCDIAESSFLDCPLLNMYCNYYSDAIVTAIEKDYPFFSIPTNENTNNGVLNRTKSNYYLNSKSLTINGAMRLHTSYEIKATYMDKISSPEIVIYVPKNTKLLQGGINQDNKSVNDDYYKPNYRVVKIPIKNKNGNITVDLLEEYRDYIKSYAYLAYTLNGKRQFEVINAINELSANITITAPEVTSKKTVEVSGIGPVSSTVKLYVNNRSVKSITANKNGRWSGTVELSSPEDYKSYSIKAKTINEYGENVEADATIMYLADAPVLKSIIMGYTENEKKRSQEIFAVDNQEPIIYYQPSVPFTFEVLFDNNKAIDKVYVTSTRNNVKKELEAKYDSQTGKYIANGYFDKNDKSYIPGDIEVEYTTKTQKINKKTILNTANKISQQVQRESGLIIRKTEESDHKTSAKVDLSPLMESFGKVVFDATIEHYDNKTGSELSDLLGIGKDVLEMTPYFVPGLDDNKYIFDVDTSTPGDTIITVLGFAKDTAGVIKSASKIHLSGIDVTDPAFMDAFNNNVIIGRAADSLGFIYNTANIWMDYNKLGKEIDKSDIIADKEEAHRLNKQLAEDQFMFALLMLTLPIIAGGSVMTTPALLFSGMLVMMNASGQMIFGMREKSILAGKGRLRFVIDPSGYVYDIRTNERIQDATVTAHYIPYNGSDDFWDKKPSDNQYGTVWKSEEYDQSNPLTTNSEGKYQWDVPEGWWRVKAEKSGYRTTWSEWMTVPPIQTEVNIGMIRDGGDVKYLDIELEKTNFIYDGAKKTPKVTVKNFDYTLIENKDYKISYKNNISAGNGVVTITGIGKYSGAISKKFTIKQANIEQANVTGIVEKNYNGKPQTQNLKVTMGDSTLKRGTDYILEYKNNTKIGTATVDIIGKGNYKGKISKKFQIVKTQSLLKTVRRAYGDSRYDTAFAIADAYLVDSGKVKSVVSITGNKRSPSLGAIIVACGTNYPDALAASYLASVKKAPVIVWREKDNAKVQEYIKANLKSGGYVYIMGGTGAVSGSIAKGLSGYKFVRYGDENRYGTNVKILTAAKVTGGEILVCDGTDFKNALIASATGKPLLLVKPTGVTREGLNFIKGLKNPSFTIIGNDKSVATSVETQLAAYGKVTRVSGSTPDEVSVNVAKKYFKNPKEVMVATSVDFPDGLCGGLLAIQNKAPMLLLTDKQNSKSVAYAKTLTSLERVTAFGGTAVVSDTLTKKLLNVGTKKIDTMEYYRTQADGKGNLAIGSREI